MIKITLFILALLLPCGCIQSYDYSHIYVSKALDGDTVVLANGEHLRYIGIDTPETNIKRGGKFIYEPQPYALEAKRLNKKLVEGKIVRIEFDLEKKDRFNRLLGYCFINDTFVNERLLKDGLAVLYTSPPNIKHVDTLVAAQKDAQKRKAGMWGTYETISPNETYRFVDQIRTIRGKVKKTKITAKFVSLNFGTGSDFCVIIFNDALKYFRSARISPENHYTEKTIEVSGKIRRYKNKTEIIIRSPTEIRVIEETSDVHIDD